MKEAWKDVPGLEGQYQASSLGRVRSLDREVVRRSRLGAPVIHSLKGRILSIKRSRNSGGYLSVALGRSSSLMLHRVIAMAFHGRPKPGAVVNHKNGIKTDNRASNIEWISYRQNCLHSRNELGKRGQCLTVADVREIVWLSHMGARTTDIALDYGMTRHGVSGILTGRFWPCADYPEIAEARKKFRPRLRHKKHRLY